MSAQITGTVATVTFHNEENGSFVAKVQPDGELAGMPVIPVLGTSKNIYPGEVITATGEWVNSPVWGRQFKARSLALSQPTRASGILKYLQSGAIKGVGKETARRIVERFGDATFDVLENAPERLAEIKGLGGKRLAALMENAKGSRVERDIMSFLHANGITTSVARKIFEAYGSHAVAKLRENPYRLSAEIFRVGFLTTDRFALNLGVPRDSQYRLQAGLNHLLAEASSAGSCGLPVSLLISKASELLGTEADPIEAALAVSLAQKMLVKDFASGQQCVFLPRLYRAEHVIAALLTSRAKAPPLCDEESAVRLIARAEAMCRIPPLGEEQRAAVALALRSRIAVITGGPGRGKTSCIKVLVTALKLQGKQMKLAAPTGKASKRLSEATGEPAATLHTTLGAGSNGWQFNSSNPLPTDVLIVDEFSMVDVPLAATLLTAIEFDTQLIVVGDKDQLPSVGPGRVFADLVAAGTLPVGLLQKTYRQAEGSLIITAANCINAGTGLPDAQGSDYIFLSKKEPEEVAKTIVQQTLAMRARGMDPLRDVQVLSPMRKSAVGTAALNEALRAALLPGASPLYKVTEFKSFRVGDKVIQTKNNRALKVMNGEIGYVTGILGDLLAVEFDGIGSIHYSREDARQLELAYCITIHKSQGSEAPVVIIPICTSHFIMMQRNLLYTGMTRAKKLLLLVGQKWVAKKAAQNAVLEDRYSMLLRLLKEQATP